jgi:hypothetical protein
MPEQANARTDTLGPKERRFYIYLSICYGFCAAIDVRHLLSPNSHRHYPEWHWHWMIWNQIVATIFCIYICFTVFSAVKNWIEKTISVLTMGYLALAATSLFHSLGYIPARLPQNRLVYACLASAAALLMFWRTFQVLKNGQQLTDPL